MTSTTPPLIHDNAPDDRFLAHHFESYEQQFDAGKLGMWIFLVTEVLFFSALFVAYAVYRSNHPEVFVYAHQFLNTTLGAVNTVVLLCSSLTMAWAVRAAQLNQRHVLVRCLALTLCFAGFFLGIKAVEYSTKWNEGLLWAGGFRPDLSGRALLSPALLALCAPAACVFLAAGCGWLLWRRRAPSGRRTVLLTATWTAVSFLFGTSAALLVMSNQHHGPHEAADSAVRVPAGDTAPDDSSGNTPPRLAGVFFSIYYAMTGVHAIHILAGMGVIGWLLLRASRGDFSADYFGPVDYVGLYWHLVDLVWIYLFPMLYLIH